VTKKIYLFSFFFMFLVVMPVIVPLFTSFGLTMRQVFELQSWFGLTIVVAEVPMGYLADVWGRKNIVIAGSLINALGFTLLAFAHSYNELLGFEIIAAIGTSFISGADVSLLYDSVDKERASGTKALANMQLAAVSGESMAAILGGILVGFSFQHVTTVNAITAWLPFFIALTFIEPAYEKMAGANHRDNFTRVLRHIFLSQDKLLRLVFVNLIVWGLSTFFAVWMHQKYWEENGLSLVYFGWLWAAYNLLTGIIGTQVHRLEHRFGPQPLLWFIGLAPIVAYWCMSWLTGMPGIAICFLFSAGRGVTHVLLRDALNWRTPSAFRATANSLQSFFFRGGFAVFGPGVGFLIDRYGMPFALRVLAGSFALLFLVLLVPLMRALRKTTYIPSGGL
jgi:MFS family permease